MTIFTDPIQSDSYMPLRVQVYKAVRDAIVTGKLKPGERIIEDRICSELGVSRSPLREALRKLEGEGLVSILPRRGAIVTELSDREGLDLFDVREVLEGLATRAAARRITDEEIGDLEEVCKRMDRALAARDTGALVELNTQFHRLVTLASRNRWLKEFMPSVRDQTRRFYRSAVETPSRGQRSVAEHWHVLDALKRRDADEAEEVARKHVQRARQVAADLASRRQGSPHEESPEPNGHEAGEA